MVTSIERPTIARHRAQLIAVSIIALLVAVVLLGVVLTAEAQAYTYNEQEIAFVNLINQYRTSKGLTTLLVSDSVSAACYKHSHDMAKYAFFDHYTVKSDWFAANASPWDRMAANGYAYNTNKGENIAAGQRTAQIVFDAWKASAGHNANMLNSTFKVIGVSFYTLAGSPYTVYWTTDFGGYVDPTAHKVSISSGPTTTRYEQTDGRLKWVGTWTRYDTTSASGSSYLRTSSNSASVTVKFTGTYLAWIATAGKTTGKAYVSLDGGTAKLVDLARTATNYKQSVWNTGTLVSGPHTVKIWRYPGNIAGKFIDVDAFDVIGTLN
jgi:uncharacterized protein YkwD